MARHYIAFVSAILLFILSWSSLQAQDVSRESLTLTGKQVLTGFSVGVGTGAVMSGTGIWTMLNALGSPFIEKTQFYIGVGLLITSPITSAFASSYTIHHMGKNLNISYWPTLAGAVIPALSCTLLAIYAIRTDKEYLILLSPIAGVILSPIGAMLGHLSGKTNATKVR